MRKFEKLVIECPRWGAGTTEDDAQFYGLSNQLGK